MVGVCGDYWFNYLDKFMTNPIKEKIIKEFPDYFDRAVSECLAQCDDKNTHVELLNHFLSPALDRYAREVIDEILPEEKTERSRPEIYPTTGFEVATYEEKEAFNSCLSEVKRRADELLDKE